MRYNWTVIYNYQESNILTVAETIQFIVFVSFMEDLHI
jgi:hypothetical protein